MGSNLRFLSCSPIHDFKSLRQNKAYMFSLAHLVAETTRLIMKMSGFLNLYRVLQARDIQYCTIPKLLWPLQDIRIDELVGLRLD